jgi:hypothetical protein
VPRVGTKSAAGVRMVPLLPALQHETLLEHRATRPYAAQEPVLPTRNGTRNTPNNVLNRIVVPVRDEANRLLAERGEEPIECLTPHTLRRTFASILALCEVHPRGARQLMGIRTRARPPTSTSRISTTPTTPSDILPVCRNFRGAAEGTRTPDLLHGKRWRIPLGLYETPANRLGPGRVWVRPASGFIRMFPGGFRRETDAATARARELWHTARRPRQLTMCVVVEQVSGWRLAGAAGGFCGMA